MIPREEKEDSTQITLANLFSWQSETWALNFIYSKTQFLRQKALFFAVWQIGASSWILFSEIAPF